jgi:xanthine dehydrogenase accessory factor
VRGDGDCAGTIGGGRLEHRAQARAAALIAASASTPELERIALGPALGQCCGGEVTLLFEPFPAPTLRIALFGAGHVGRALVEVLAGVTLRLDWFDPRAELFPPTLPPGMHRHVAALLADEVRDLAPGSVVLAMTHRHDLDLDIAAAAIGRGDLAYVGVIGSATKAARFRARLAERGLDPARLTCPIGVPGLASKHPRAVAIAIAAEILGRGGA